MTHFPGHRNNNPRLAKQRLQEVLRRRQRLAARRRILFTGDVQQAAQPLVLAPIPEALQAHGYDPELLYVECGRCGAPVIWEKAPATRLLEQAGIDRLELDPACLLVTDACPMCTGNSSHYTVQIFRVSAPETAHTRQMYGTA